MFLIFGIVGSGAGGLVADVYGRKPTLAVFHVPFLCSWVLMACATNVYQILSARCLSGFSVGALMALLPVYVTEISRVKSRGTFSIIE